MSLPSFDSAIVFLETQLEALDAKRAKVLAALEALRDIGGAVQTAHVKKPRPAPQRAAREASEGTTTTRPAGAPSTLRRAAVLAALKSGPLSLAGLATAAGLDKESARYPIALLVKEGRVRRTGQTSQTRYALT